MMVVSGFLLAARDIRIITLKGNRDSHELISQKINKLSLPKNPTQDDVDVFSQAFKAYCADNKIKKIIANRRLTSGQRAGGSSTFIIEGILLAISNIPIEFVHPATIRATDKKDKGKKTNKPKTLDLGKAYDFGFEGLA